jgi:hypothetical protein
VVGSSCGGGGVLDFGGAEAGDASGSSSDEAGTVGAAVGMDGSEEAPGATAAGALITGVG